MKLPTKDLRFYARWVHSPSGVTIVLQFERRATRDAWVRWGRTWWPEAGFSALETTDPLVSARTKYLAKHGERWHSAEWSLEGWIPTWGARVPLEE